MRAVALVGLLILSSFGSVAAWQPQTGHGETIGLLNGNIDSIPLDQMTDVPRHGFWMLTHEYPVPSNWIDDLADAGVECWSFLPDSAFHCELNGHTPSQLAKLEVNGMIQMPPSAKLHPHLLPSLEGKMESWFITKNLGMINVVLSGTDLPEGIDQRNDVEVLSHSYRWATVEVKTSGVHWLSQQSEVEWIEPKFERKLFNDVADDIVSADVLRDATQMAGINSAWNSLDGTGIIVTVSDTGLDNGINNTNMHPDFKDHIVGIHSYGVRPVVQSWVNAPYNDGASDLDSGHGTHVAGSVLGDGTQSSGT
ncbi:MAG: S8 family serine peptidase, partial [Candidatus Poseidoniaceae archaeon]